MIPRSLGLAAVIIALSGALVGTVACGASATKRAGTPPKAIASTNFKNATRCDSSKPGRELSYHDLAGTGKPDMVEVIGYSKQASGMSEGRPLCMELDTNRDGKLDLLRVFDDNGEIESEEADRNYDGKSDVWISYEKGLITKIAFDTQFKGLADEFHYYRDGKLKRIERDRNGDGKIDVWEFYLADGKLERMGVDLDLNGKVDVWYRDELARAEQKKADAAKTTTAGSAGPASAGPANGPGPAPSASAKPK
ncbi:MAG: hypothetical protein NVS3B10_18600 [Polyangiales bacterium]